jgi:hypothetical protein
MVATVAVASGVAVAAPAGPAGRTAPARAAARTVADPVNLADLAREVAQVKVLHTAVERRMLAAEARRAAARRAARRRAAARRAARQSASQSAQQPSSSSAAPSVAPSGSAQQIAQAMLGSFGWSSSQFGCLQSLWNAESGWNPYASNPTSGAYGIPQALPGAKMASAGPDWQTNPATQIRWGLGYIKGLYGSPCGAWSHEESAGWY